MERAAGREDDAGARRVHVGPRPVVVRRGRPGGADDRVGLVGAPASLGAWAVRRVELLAQHVPVPQVPLERLDVVARGERSATGGRPSVAPQPTDVDAAVLGVVGDARQWASGPPQAGRGPGLRVFLDAVQPHVVVVHEEPAAVPRVAGRVEVEGLQPRSTRDRGVRERLPARRPPAVEREVDEVLPVGRQVGPQRGEGGAHVLPDLERVVAQVPSDGGGEPVPHARDDDGVPPVPREDRVQSRGHRGRGHPAMVREARPPARVNVTSRRRPRCPS